MARMDELGFALLRRWEGCRFYAYDDYDDRRAEAGERIFGTLRIGYGHAGRDVVPELVWTQQQADDALVQDVGVLVQTLAPVITASLNDNQFSAFVCLAYNIGLPAFRDSSALHLANSGRLEDVPAQIMLLDKTTMDGIQIESPGLRNRRQAEVTLWNT